MVDISSPAITMALGALAIGLLVLLAIRLRGKPKRAEKWEKAAIMRQLLALSEQEQAMKQGKPVARTPVPARKVVARSGNLPVNARTKSPVMARTKVR